MEDKKVMEFIQKQHERLLEQDRIKRIKQKKLERVGNVIFYIVVIVGIVLMFNYLRVDNKKAMAHCISQGYSENYCLTK